MRKVTIVFVFLIVFVVTANELFAQRKAVSGAEVTGTFSTGGEAANEVKILALGKGKLKVEFSLIYVRTLDNGEEMAYTGEPGGIADIVGDEAFLNLGEDDRVCKIKIHFVEPGKIEVSENGDCVGIVGGMNVTSEGTYKKISNAKPTFREN